MSGDDSPNVLSARGQRKKQENLGLKTNLRVLRLLKDLLKSSQNYKYQTYKLLINQQNPGWWLFPMGKKMHGRKMKCLLCYQVNAKMYDMGAHNILQNIL